MKLLFETSTRRQLLVFLWDFLLLIYPVQIRLSLPLVMQTYSPVFLWHFTDSFSPFLWHQPFPGICCWGGGTKTRITAACSLWQVCSPATTHSLCVTAFLSHRCLPFHYKHSLLLNDFQLYIQDRCHLLPILNLYKRLSLWHLRLRTSETIHETSFTKHCPKTFWNLN